MSRIEHLVTRLDAACETQPFETSWYVRDLASGDDAARTGDAVRPSASTRKIAILLAALAAVEDGRLRLDQPVAIEQRHQVSDSGCFQHLTPGVTVPLRDALVMMIVVSDNACTGAVVELVGLAEVNRYGGRVGLAATTHRQAIPPGDLAWDHPVEATNSTTVADLGRLLERLLAATTDPSDAAAIGLSQDAARWALRVLSWQTVRDRIPFLLPPDTPVAHKTGDGLRNFGDAGIVFADGRPRFVFAAMTDRVPPETADGFPGRAAAVGHVAQLARSCWDSLVCAR